MSPEFQPEVSKHVPASQAEVLQSVTQTEGWCYVLQVSISWHVRVGVD